ncbi:cytochrome b5 [Gorgonomyces haynaldii]|nr:cytochrome b5 [Gorgonomyces haynaldii]
MSLLTAEQVKAHSTRKDCWMIIDDKVYDVTKFLDEHPGGEEVLIELAGQDATEAFEEIGHSQDARDLLTKMLVGQVDPATLSKKKAAPKPAPVAHQEKADFGMLYLLVPVVVAVLAYYFTQQ